MKEYQIHTIKPVYDKNSKILILGSMPSPKSRETRFFYGHPSNRFWRVLAGVFEAEIPLTNDEKRVFLLKRNIALWDVLYSCKIRGAEDASIEDPVPNNLSLLLKAAPIRAVFATGGKADELYRRFCLAEMGIPSIRLPSTSPANRSRSFEALVESYRVILEYL